MTGEGAASAGLGDDHPAVELSQPSEEELAETTEETVYTSGISELWWWWFNVSCTAGSPCIPYTYASQISYFATVLANNENGCGHIENVVMFISLSLSHSLTHPCTHILIHTGQMWSSAGSAQEASQGSSLLMLGGGSESEGEGVGGINGRSGGKSSLIETSEVQEEVELLSQQEH